MEKSENSPHLILSGFWYNGNPVEKIVLKGFLYDGVHEEAMFAIHYSYFLCNLVVLSSYSFVTVEVIKAEEHAA